MDVAHCKARFIIFAFLVFQGWSLQNGIINLQVMLSISTCFQSFQGAAYQLRQCRLPESCFRRLRQSAGLSDLDNIYETMLMITDVGYGFTVWLDVPIHLAGQGYLLSQRWWQPIQAACRFEGPRVGNGAMQGFLVWAQHLIQVEGQPCVWCGGGWQPQFPQIWLHGLAKRTWTTFYEELQVLMHLMLLFWCFQLRPLSFPIIL